MSVTDIINGKVVAITGASSGIGEATATLLARRGCRIVAGARRVDRLADLAERIEGEGGEIVVVPTDVTRREDLVRLVATATERFGRLDALVANAGAMPIGPFDALRVDDWMQMVDVNLKGVLHGIAAALPVFRAQGSGHFVTTGSTAAHRVVPAQGVYAGTKAAVHAICEGLRQEAGDALRVTIVAPGFVRTASAEHVHDPETRERIAELRDRIAIAPEAIAGAITYALEQPPDVDVGEIVIRPTAQA